MNWRIQTNYDFVCTAFSGVAYSASGKSAQNPIAETLVDYFHPAAMANRIWLANESELRNSSGRWKSFQLFESAAFALQPAFECFHKFINTETALKTFRDEEM